MRNERLIKLLEEQLKIEKESVQALRAEQKNINHLGVKLLFEICAADSAKHARMVKLILDHLKAQELSRETFVSTWRQRNRGQAISDHIEREEQLIRLRRLVGVKKSREAPPSVWDGCLL